MNYDAWAKAYDYVFPYKPQTFKFLDNHLKRGTICDVACGTGTYALALAEAGYPVAAYDLSEALIDEAKWKTPADLPVTFSVMDMREFPLDKAYSGIYCIGNSLVHLQNETEIKNVLERFKASLKPGGDLIIQIVNYDRILDAKIDQLPKLENPPYVMTRHYRFEAGKILFETELFDGETKQKSIVRLYPLRSDALRRLLHETGFTIQKLYGGFDASTYKAETSFALVVHAKL